MAVNPQLYNQNYGQMWNDNLPPDKRLPKMLAWGAWLLRSLQWFRDLIFNDYLNGSSAPDWVTGTVYSYGNRVRFTDNRVYELTNIAGLTSTVTPDKDQGNWFMVLDSWIGLNERIKYSSQKLLFEYLLNKFFRVPVPPANQIYITRNFTNYNTFWLAQSSQGVRNSYMAQNSKYSKQFMPQTSSALQQYAFTIHVPTSIYTQIGTTIPAGSSSTADDVIRAVADNYVRAGKNYNIVTY